MSEPGNEQRNNDNNDWTKNFRNPIIVLAYIVMVSTIMLIGASVLGIDHGVLPGMAKIDFARGLITYLFAIVTIGIAVALVMAALTGPAPTASNDARFQRGKEILSLLLGVFGTIVGFYFGSEVAKSKEEVPFQISTLDLAPQPVGPAGTVSVRAVLRGGVAPYRFGVGQGDEKVDAKESVFEGGWIVKQLQLPPPKSGEIQTVHVLAEDSAGKRIETAAPVRRSSVD
ncbi:MAG TPA: hypothetical protein VN890_07705 [Methylocella sp.]|nr:hypothetical protein [Methylocella sp.]